MARTTRIHGAMLLAAAGLAASSGGAATPVFINELHYDNAGRDAGEAVEVAGLAGTDLAGWRLVLYNGGAGAPYRTVALTGAIPDLENGLGTRAFVTPALQNGAPDGVALLDPSGVVAELLSYEGVFTARTGPATGLASVDVGVAESGTTLAGTSLQLTGIGRSRADYAWRAGIAATFGAVNEGQRFAAPDAGPRPLPAPPTWLLLAGGLVGLASARASVRTRWCAGLPGSRSRRRGPSCPAS